MIEAGSLDRMFGPRPEHQAMASVLSRIGDRFLADGAARGVTALKDAGSIRREFLLDSLCGVGALPTTGSVLDIGTGGGVPGLVLAVVRPDLNFVLTDSAKKKTDWVAELVREFELSNVEVVTRRLEILGHEGEFRERFEAVTAKALASLNVLCEFALPFLRVGGRLIAYKGPATSEEIRQARRALEELRGRIYRCSGFTIGEKQTVVCEVTKSAPTPPRYPRRDGVPRRKPL